MADTPTKDGWYWAQHRILEDGSSTDTLPPVGHWEIVRVFINGGDPKGSQYLMVGVEGEAKSQSLENFVWGERIEREDTQLLASIVDAWEALAGGRQLPIGDVEHWLLNDMAPVIDKTRRRLGRKRPDGSKP